MVNEYLACQSEQDVIDLKNCIALGLMPPGGCSCSREWMDIAGGDEDGKE